MRILLAILVFSCGALCQQPDPEIVATFNQISKRAARLEPMLDQLHPNDWIAKGAPEAYVAQLKSTREQFQAIQSEMSGLAQQPDRLTESMKALFRVQATHQVLGSLMGGVRKYQNPALADLIESVAAEASGDIEKFEQYLVELAADKEQQLTVMDHEAQRCRATLLRQPAPPARPNRKN
jgi:hypothetical protein